MTIVRKENEVYCQGKYYLQMKERKQVAVLNKRGDVTRESEKEERAGAMREDKRPKL